MAVSSQNFDFFSSKIARFIETLKKIQFTGQLVWKDPNNDEKRWILHFHLGRIFYARGGIHSVRRWARSLANYCPQLQSNVAQLQQDFHQVTSEESIFDREYELFYFWVKQQQLTHKQANQVIQSISSEVLFDLSQFQNLTHQIQKVQSAREPLVLIDEHTVFTEVQKFWQSLWNHNIDPSLLDKAPIIKDPVELQQWTSVEKAQVLVQVLDGKRTLRDLAIQFGQDVVQVAYSLQPYIQSGLIELISIPDLLTPIPRAMQNGSELINSAKPLIACVDDSAMVCWTMEKLLTEAGYRFVGINDGLRAITTLLSCKPDLILLDVFMPYTNGYEICKKLRKAPSFRHTPIVFLTGLDGVIDQVRARMAGASDFLSKPVDAEKVLSTVAKHLPKGVIVPNG